MVWSELDKVDSILWPNPRPFDPEEDIPIRENDSENGYGNSAFSS
jgi:hypothetical protein